MPTMAANPVPVLSQDVVDRELNRLTTDGDRIADALVALEAHPGYSFLQGGTTTKNERARESLEVIRGEILDMAKNAVTEEELDKGKRYLIGSYPLRFDTSTKIAGQLVQMLRPLDVGVAGRRLCGTTI